MIVRELIAEANRDEQYDRKSYLVGLVKQINAQIETKKAELKTLQDRKENLLGSDITTAE